MIRAPAQRHHGRPLDLALRVVPGQFLRTAQRHDSHLRPVNQRVGIRPANRADIRDSDRAPRDVFLREVVGLREHLEWTVNLAGSQQFVAAVQVDIHEAMLLNIQTRHVHAFFLSSLFFQPWD